VSGVINLIIPQLITSWTSPTKIKGNSANKGYSHRQEQKGRLSSALCLDCSPGDVYGQYKCARGIFFLDFAALGPFLCPRTPTNHSTLSHVLCQQLKKIIAHLCLFYDKLDIP